MAGKRKRPYGESQRIAYKSISFSPLEATDHPRSPHRFFRDSYTTAFDTSISEKSSIDSEKNSLPECSELSQVVHHHVNGLCIVTAGQNLPDRSTVAGIEFVAKEAPACSAAEKRKRQAKMLKGGKVDDVVTPTTIIAKLKLESGDTLPLYACVWGTILEVNNSLTVDILFDDALLDGYLAVILPSGNFPPRARESAAENVTLETSKA
jgi:hypothetical protein